MKEIEWIKSAMALCISNTTQESDKRVKLEELGEQYDSFSSTEKDTITTIIKTQFAAKDSIYVYSCFLHYMGGKEPFAEAIMDAILDGDYDAYTGSMLELQTRRYEEAFKWQYQKSRILHKRNVEKFDQNLQINYPYRKLADRNKKRVVIVTEQIVGTLHSPTKVVLNFAYILKKMGYEILLFSCPSDCILPEDTWFRSIIMRSLDKFISLPMKLEYRGEKFDGYQINMTQMGMKEYHMMLTMIYDWNPYFVFDLGTANPVVDLVTKFTTQVVFEMSILCPTSEGDIFVRTGFVGTELEDEYVRVLGDRQKQIFTDEKLPILMEEIEHKGCRAEMGLPENRFLVAIVGNRLDLEIHSEFIGIMNTMLYQLPDMDFVMIGKCENLRQQFGEEEFAERVHFLGFRRDLMSVYSVMDLYLNPKRKTGGGFSGAMALMADLPIVTLPDCDVSCMTGQEFVVADYEQMVETVVRYATDQEYYHKKVLEAQKCKVKNSDQKLEQYTKKILDQVFELMEERETKDDRIQ